MDICLYINNNKKGYSVNADRSTAQDLWKCYSSKTGLYGPVNCPTKLQCIEDKHLPLEWKRNRWEIVAYLLLQCFFYQWPLMQKLTLDFGIRDISRPKTVTTKKASVFRGHSYARCPPFTENGEKLEQRTIKILSWWILRWHRWHKYTGTSLTTETPVYLLDYTLHLWEWMRLIKVMLLFWKFTNAYGFYCNGKTFTLSET